MKCVNMGDHENCIDGKYHSSTTYPACDEDHLGETGCYREKTVTERCNYSASRTDPTCVCDARRNCERKKTVTCDDDDTSCEIKGTYTQKHYSDCTTAQAGVEGCRLVNTTYPAACSTSDVDSNGNFKGRTNCATDGGACIHNCGFTGNYKKVEQTVHSCTGNTKCSKCAVYEIYTEYNTNVNKYGYKGEYVGTQMHGGISGNLKTDYSSGTVNYCGSGNTSCEVNYDALSPISGVCETDGVKSKDTWKDHLISNHTYYSGDSTKIRPTISGYHEKYVTNLENLSKLSNEFAKCQNFNIYNKTIASENSGYKTPLIYNNSGKLYNTGATGITLNNPISSSLNIDTKLEPSGTFGYDEDYYMSLMKDDRVIAKNSSINYSYKTEMYNDQSIRNGFTSCYGSEGEYLAADGSVRSCSESIDYTAGTISVNSNIAGVPKAFEFVLCNINNDYSYSTNSDLCTKTLFYYYDVNYVKQSLTSSASYDNNITWYRYTANDKIFPGKGMGTAASKADAASRYSNYSLTEDEYNLWSAMGTKNVFPVSLNTRRNIYQYYYTFKGIGNYYNGAYDSDRNSIGRLTGYEDSIIKSNSRVCFYEVYESACICCGQNDLGVVSSGSGINSYEYVGYTPSGMGSGSGHYGFTTSTVSLYNLKGFSSNANSSNWSAGETYFYDGSNKYKTDKGKELAGYIEQKGENVYAEIPEYSYVLTPNAMANIRKNNTEGKYGYGRDTIYAVENGTYLAHSGNKNHIPNSNETSRIIFTHFGSNFVKNELSAYETPEYKGKLLSNMSMSSECYVEKNGISSMEDKKKKGCKWVDYVQPVNPDGSGGYFRMAFK